MVVFPNCKINLGLNIIRNRADGYHDIESVFLPLPYYDALELIKTDEDQATDPAHYLHGLLFSTSGMLVGGRPEDNLCVKAYQLLKRQFPGISSIRMHLHKVIPQGAGLGGGSADGAFALKLINQEFNLRLSTAVLIKYAQLLGSDCPFFIVNEPSFATGLGEQLKPVVLDLSGYDLVLVHANVHVNTAEAFSSVTPSVNSKPIHEIVSRPVQTWRGELKNDFEGPVFGKHPLLRQLRDELYNFGAAYASLTGSGGAIYGLFEKFKVPDMDFPKDYIVRQFALR